MTVRIEERESGTRYECLLILEPDITAGESTAILDWLNRVTEKVGIALGRVIPDHEAGLKPVTMALDGEDGNAFHLLGAFAANARRSGWTDQEIEAVRTEAMTGNYDHLLQTLLKHVSRPGDVAFDAG